jgi:hypothetical protein
MLAHGADYVVFTIILYHNLQCLAKQFDLTEHVCGRRRKRMHELREGIAMNHDTRFANSQKVVL